MKYDKEATDKLTELHATGMSTADIALVLDTTERSVIAKLSSMGLYKKKAYVNKQGNPPVKKGEYIERIAELLDVNVEILDSLEKVNKNVLQLLEKALQDA